MFHSLCVMPQLTDQWGKSWTDRSTTETVAALDMNELRLQRLETAPRCSLRDRSAKNGKGSPAAWPGVLWIQRRKRRLWGVVREMFQHFPSATSVSRTTLWVQLGRVCAVHSARQVPIWSFFSVKRLNLWELDGRRQKQPQRSRSDQGGWCFLATFGHKEKKKKRGETELRALFLKCWFDHLR